MGNSDFVNKSCKHNYSENFKDFKRMSYGYYYCYFKWYPWNKDELRRFIKEDYKDEDVIIVDIPNAIIYYNERVDIEEWAKINFEDQYKSGDKFIFFLNQLETISPNCVLRKEDSGYKKFEKGFFLNIKNINAILAIGFPLQIDYELRVFTFKEKVKWVRGWMSVIFYNERKDYNQSVLTLVMNQLGDI